jgi:phage shock protein PspC (stress-responsive transcriptional regulator)
MQNTNYRRLTRSHDRMIGGVCAGVADFLGIDPTLVRVVTAVAGVIAIPVVPLLYVICWAVIPQD